MSRSTLRSGASSASSPVLAAMGILLCSQVFESHRTLPIQRGEMQRGGQSKRPRGACLRRGRRFCVFVIFRKNRKRREKRDQKLRRDLFGFKPIFVDAESPDLRIERGS